MLKHTIFATWKSNLEKPDSTKKINKDVVSSITYDGKNQHPINKQNTGSEI